LKESSSIDMLAYEKEAAGEGFGAVCGVDEAGRGPLAGPVYAAAVILRPGQQIEGVNDSKKLTEKRREALFEVIQREALCWSIAFAEPEEIDTYNILGATYLAMNRAVEGLSCPADCALVDGNRDPGLGIPTRTIVKGDGLSASIAAASILAKVARDRYMLEMDKQYPQYKFCRHKGYPTKLHYDMIAVHGVCPIHRRSFLKTLEKHLSK
jgi:ribonuclease HII